MASNRRKSPIEKRVERPKKKRKDVLLESKERYVRAKFAMMKMKEMEKREAMERRRTEVANQVKDVHYRPWRIKSPPSMPKTKRKVKEKSKAPKKCVAKLEEAPAPEKTKDRGMSLLLPPQ
eukprot:TRINITY_DN1533_c3_g1_i1.p1 TRINITY_DN1533_c3_g1~~TRINITY_DN1533_c3_g1_i1.p1  ORF type:complete len:139 (-),score=41.27 TRINITY_DN1533_c3_g1_i1:104-466(-)